MNKTLKNRILKQLRDAAKTYEVIANKQKQAGMDKNANVTMVRKMQIDSVISDVEATIEQSPKRPSAKKNTRKPKAAKEKA